jgi:serine phosphatase RsbU (regulator of sigma subunit)
MSKKALNIYQNTYIANTPIGAAVLNLAPNLLRSICNFKIPSVYERPHLVSKQDVLIDDLLDQKAALNELEEKNKQILESIAYAKRLQQSILPSSETINDRFAEHFVINKPKDIVSGDFYFVEPIAASDGRDLTAFAVADCTGHGIPGAFMSMLSYGILKSSLNDRNINSAGDVLDYLNKCISQAFHNSESSDKVRDGMDISFCVLDNTSKMLQFSGANSKGIIIKKDRTFIELMPDRQAIGYDEQSSSFNTHYLQMEEGDTIYLFSDGFRDQFGGVNGKKLGYKNFVKKLTEVHTQPLHHQRSNIENYFETWKGSHQQLDDVLLLGIKI